MDDKNLYAPLRQWPCDIGSMEQRPGLHLVDSSDHGAAHVCSAITSDSDADDDMPGQGAGVFLIPVCVALSGVACWALYAWLTVMPQ